MKGKVITGIILGCIVAIIVIVILSCSIESIPANTMAVRFDTWKQRLFTENILSPGVQWIGPTSKTIQFPTSTVLLSFVGNNSIHGRTLDGLEISITAQIAFQYKRESIGKLYENYMDDYMDFITNVAQNVVRNAFNDYPAQDIRTKWDEVYVSISGILSDEMEQMGLTLQSLETETPVMPLEYKEMLNKVSSMQQSVKTAESQKDKAQAEIDAQIQVSKTKAGQKLTEAKASVDVNEKQKVAEAEARCSMAVAEASKALQQKEIITNDQELLNLLRVRALESSLPKQILMGTTGANPVVRV